jgi:hypothetical protein
VFFAAVAVLIVALVGWAMWGATPPRQAELLERFQASRPVYDQLRQMVVDDRLVTVGDYGDKFARKPYLWTSANKAAISEVRQQAYASLMKQTDAQRIDLLENGFVSISMASWGMANNGWRITLMWCASEPTPLVNTIDGFQKSKTDNWEEAYSHVEGNWYFRIIS